MSDFLKKWDEIVRDAQAKGVSQYLWRFHEASRSFVPAARTRHPLFMGATPPKLDPERDR